MRSSLNTLRAFAGKRPSVEQTKKFLEEICEFCSSPVLAEHQHLLNSKHNFVCCCDACAALFDHQGVTQYQRVPRRVHALKSFHMSDAQWDGLMIPISMAFFSQRRESNKVAAYYPSPAGATESLLPLDTWQELVTTNPILQEFEKDSEALLVNRVGESREYFRAPIDECFKLVGIIRMYWNGFSGGPKVWSEIDHFFERLRKIATNV